VRIVVAACTVDYEGRLSAALPAARRLLVVKADGSVLVHADSGGYKPLNWMSSPCSLVEHADRWEVTNAKGERLVIRFTDGGVDFDHRFELGGEPGLAKDGVEAHLQELLAGNPSEVEPGLVLVRREHETALGPVDLLCRAPDGCWVAVEVKRRGEIAGVEQLLRYVEFLARDGVHTPVRGVLVGQQVVRQARTLAAARGLGWAEIDYDRLRGLGADTLRLF
jgi:endonuclease